MAPRNTAVGGGEKRRVKVMNGKKSGRRKKSSSASVLHRSLFVCVFFFHVFVLFAGLPKVQRSHQGNSKARRRKKASGLLIDKEGMP